ncbi:ATP-grasp domain-containing protein [Hyphomicrobium sp. D-2]|uniref:ATP-grasp domain-containing protein n=1 Tax=Hyphomicrobium sp. D-2 TaxID=3041621 RepID=UPI0024542122|nr:ATP-grasp domain-containing protein [Hyphomicrobium sp. D-2]MDH4981102.1 ATP-grasp domain-containing protein [Hyphomicrobium sp. D-2]
MKTGVPVLIAALSGRGLCASARRAGYLPYVADAFSDRDTRAMAAQALRIADAMRLGIRAKPLFHTLDALIDAAPKPAAGAPPIGLLLGSGFEDRPKLVAALAQRYRMLGNSADAIRACNDPVALTALLDARGIPHPETRKLPPENLDGWLAKRIGGSGGTHISPKPTRAPAPRRYYQQRLNGEAVSTLALAANGAARIVGFSRQWFAGTGPRPFRYGGAVGPVDLAPAAQDAMAFATHEVCNALQLSGLVSFDFLLCGAVPYLLEVNPRPGATLDVFDDEHGTLFHAHMAACSGENLAGIALPALERAKASAILYADRDRLTIPRAFQWPQWAADIPDPASRIPRYRPIATVYADASTTDEALQRCRERLEELGSMLYAQAQNRERTTDADIQRPRP